MDNNPQPEQNEEEISVSPSQFVPWHSNHEKVLIEYSDKAMCYAWMHFKSFRLYTFKYQLFTIPVIIMSTLTGTANFAQGRVPIEYRGWAQVAIGSINLLAGILTTISQFLKVSELNESHRVSAISWGRLHRMIKLELTKERLNRMPVVPFLSKCQEQFDMLVESSPTIDESTITAFRKEFTSSKKAEIAEKKNILYKNFAEISKPDICNELVSTGQSLYIPGNSRPNSIMFNGGFDDIISKNDNTILEEDGEDNDGNIQMKRPSMPNRMSSADFQNENYLFDNIALNERINQRQRELEEQQRIIEEDEQRREEEIRHREEKERKKHEEIVERFVDNFQRKKDRFPLESELVDNMALLVEEIGQDELIKIMRAIPQESV